MIHSKKEWQKLFNQLMWDFRQSENDLTKITTLRQSTINRITRGETQLPYPSTIQKIETKLNIRIYDDNERI